MVSNFHGKIVLVQGIHGVVALEYDNAIERLADEDFVIEDRYKIAYQIDNGTFWCLVDETIPQWQQLCLEGIEYINGASGVSKNIDFNNGKQQSLDLTADCSLILIPPEYGVGEFSLRTTQGSSPWSITWVGPVKWEGGSMPSPSSVLGEEDIYYFTYNGGFWYGSAKLNFS